MPKTATCVTTLGNFTIELYTEQMPISACEWNCDFYFIFKIVGSSSQITSLILLRVDSTMDYTFIELSPTSWISLDALIPETPTVVVLALADLLQDRPTKYLARARSPAPAMDPSPMSLESLVAQNWAMKLELCPWYEPFFKCWVSIK